MFSSLTDWRRQSPNTPQSESTGSPGGHRTVEMTVTVVAIALILIASKVSSRQLAASSRE
jgi:hypothetical protein